MVLYCFAVEELRSSFETVGGIRWHSSVTVWVLTQLLQHRIAQNNKYARTLLSYVDLYTVGSYWVAGENGTCERI